MGNEPIGGRIKVGLEKDKTLNWGWLENVLEVSNSALAEDADELRHEVGRFQTVAGPTALGKVVLQLSESCRSNRR